jgi:hypothetical protein
MAESASLFRLLTNLHQLQPLQARVPVLAVHQMIVHGDAER